MSKMELLAKYSQDIEKLRQLGRDLKLSDSEINKIFKDCLKELKKSYRSNKERYFVFIIKKMIKITALLLTILVIIYIILNHHQPTLSLVLRNVQELIYPSLKILRLIAIPVISTFPSLTELYDESCLVQNPFFQVPDMECWPCEQVYSVINLTGLQNITLYQSGVPFVVKTDQKLINISFLRHYYKQNKHIFDNDASRIHSTNSKYKKISDILDTKLDSSLDTGTHISWRINRMAPARQIRQIFPRPYIIPVRSGISVERYVLIDDVEAYPYNFPDPECSYVYVIQGSGERTIVLKPSKECNGPCRSVSVTLKTSDVLHYNWWYWRPISLPGSNATNPSICYIGSYC